MYLDDEEEAKFEFTRLHNRLTTLKDDIQNIIDVWAFTPFTRWMQTQLMQLGTECLKTQIVLEELKNAIEENKKDREHAAEMVRQAQLRKLRGEVEPDEPEIEVELEEEQVEKLLKQQQESGRDIFATEQKPTPKNNDEESGPSPF